MSEKKDEHKLIEDLIRGDVSAFEEIYHMYSKRVYAFSLKYLRSKEDAEGVVQEVFIKLYKVRSRLGGIRNLESWTFTVCFNIIRFDRSIKFFVTIFAIIFHLNQIYLLIIRTTHNTLYECIPLRSTTPYRMPLECIKTIC